MANLYKMFNYDGETKYAIFFLIYFYFLKVTVAPMFHLFRGQNGIFSTGAELYLLSWGSTTQTRSLPDL